MIPPILNVPSVVYHHLMGIFDIRVLGFQCYAEGITRVTAWICFRSAQMVMWSETLILNGPLGA